MATLVFTAVGQALGGPFGAALGSLLGRTVDEQLFGSGPRKGPRLGDLSVQTSSYGSAVPRIYGAMRVAGTVIWATDLVEEESYEATGKWAPGVVRYRYSANLAVALSSRPVREVRRIWADGKLIRGATGDWKVDCAFRMMTGEADQAVDPLVASAEGEAMSPAFRGMAVALLERLDLSSFGNRIPMLTFEVVADDGDTEVGALLADASGGVISATAVGQTVAGYAAHGSRIADAVEPLIEAYGLTLRGQNDVLTVAGAGASVTIGAGELGCGADGKVHPAIEWNRQSEGDLPADLSLTHYDAAREYQAGQVRVSVGHNGRRGEQIDMPAVLTPDAAKTLASAMIVREWAKGETASLRLPPSRIGLLPGDRIVVPAHGRWQVQSIEIDGLAVVVEARRADVSLPVLTADGGRSIRSIDTAISRTSIALFEVPQGDGRSLLSVAVSSAEGFAPVPVELRVDGGLAATVAVPRKARLGALTAAMTAAAETVDVLLVDADQWLLNADEVAIAVGANRAMIGHEMIQFSTAQSLGGGAWRLSGLVRGVRSTGWAVGDHAVGERFCLVDGAAMLPVVVDDGLVGKTIVATAFGLADVAPLPTASLTYVGQSMSEIPPAVVAPPSGGNVIDGEARATIDAILAVLNANGMTT